VTGHGSKGRLKEYKIGFINKVIQMYEVSTVLDLGCGDGNQIEKIQCKNYLGVDVSSAAVAICLKKYSQDDLK